MNRTIPLTAILVIFSYLHTFAAEPATEEAAGTPAETEAPADSVADAEFTELDDFVIVQQRKLVQSDGAKLTYNVTEDPEAGNSNILEILRKVPGVTVDADDNVRVNGQTSFKILINNHEDPMLKGDIKTVLKSIPASTIKKIEVISEPGAKYEAEGVGGILNIVTDSNRSLSGFMAQLSAWVNAYQAGGNVDARTRVGNVMIGANIAYNNGRVFPRKATTERRTEDLTGSRDHLRLSRSAWTSGWDYASTRMNMSWEPDTANLFTLSAYWANNGWGNHTEEERSMLAPDLSQIWRLTRDSRYKGLYNGAGAEASYQHSFGRKDHTLVLSYLFDYGHQHNRTWYAVEESEGDPQELPYSASLNATDDISHVVQADYSNQINSHHLIEAGAKVNLNRTPSDSESMFGESEASAVIDPALTVKMKQFKDIYAAYGSYTGTFAKWTIKAGLRYEHTRMGLDYHTGAYPDFTSRLNDIVPNAAISYNMTDVTSLRLAYQTRISRPGLWALNPYVNTMTPGQIQYGNPDLKSQKSHNVSLSYSNYAGKLSGSAKVTYSYIANSINDVIFMRDGIMHSTYANIGCYQQLEIEGNLDWSITDALRWSLYASASYQDMHADSELLKASNHGWQTYFNTNVNYTMPCKVRMSAYGGFYTPWIDLQSRGSNGYYYGLSASRSFLKDDALNVSLSLNNILPVSRKNTYRQTSETVALTNTTRYKQWNVGLSVTFKFGGLKSDVKRTAANIEKESSGSKSGNK